VHIALIAIPAVHTGVRDTFQNILGRSLLLGGRKQEPGNRKVTFLYILDNISLPLLLTYLLVIISLCNAASKVSLYYAHLHFIHRLLLYNTALFLICRGAQMTAYKPKRVCLTKIKLVNKC
jgi:hypothetical protein